MKKKSLCCFFLIVNSLFSMDKLSAAIELQGDLAIEFMEVLQGNPEAFFRYCVGMRKRCAGELCECKPLAYSYSKKIVTDKDFDDPVRIFQSEDSVWVGDPAHNSLSWPNELVLFGCYFAWLENFDLGKTVQFDFTLFKLRELIHLFDFAKILRENVMYKHPQSAHCICPAELSLDDIEKFRDIKTIWEDIKLKFLVSLIEYKR